MNSLNLFSKRLTNLFVSKSSLRLNCFYVNKSFAVKYRNIFITKCFENQMKNRKTNQFFGTFEMMRHFSSKINSSEEHPKSSAYNKNDIESDSSLDPIDEESKDLKESIKTKFKKYSDEDSEVIYDVSEELLSQSRPQFIEREWKESDEELYLFQQKPKYKTKSHDLELKRGKTGVFDIHELVDLLREENIKEIAVIEVPKEMDYCQYLVLGNATSKRHLNAFCEYFNKVYKMKKSPKDPFLNFGGESSPDWRVVDMKNIVLHLFQKPTRDYYDIETLWTVGHEFDDKIQRPETDFVANIMEKHIKFLEEIKPQK